MNRTPKSAKSVKKRDKTPKYCKLRSGVKKYTYSL